MKKSDMDELSREELEKRLNWYEKRYSPYVKKRGIHNWRNLFRKPNNYEWTILFMLLMAGFIMWAYQEDTSQCRNTLKNLDGICSQYCLDVRYPEKLNEYANFSGVNLSGITKPSILKADNSPLDD